MSFSWLDFILGIMLLGSVVHLAMSFSGASFPSIFGKTPRANLIYSLVVACLSVDIYIFANGWSAFLENGFLLGGTVLYVIYLVEGRWLHRRFQQGEQSVKTKAAATF